jgi:hypothetical protein
MIYLIYLIIESRGVARAVSDLFDPFDGGQAPGAVWLLFDFGPNAVKFSQNRRLSASILIILHWFLSAQKRRDHGWNRRKIPHVLI